MRYSDFHVPTFREPPADAETPSQSFALRGGYIKKIAAGIYDYLPLGLRVLRKVEGIVRRHMNRKGAMEVSMPSMIPAELWQKSGRWYKYGKELLRIKDRAGRDFCYGPTHEEVIVDLVTNDINSYKQLPVNFYQIQTKFRDEIRPRFGLMRAREFQMKDAYSFHESLDSLDKTYHDMFDAYQQIFTDCGLKFRVVNADSGNIGGSASQEFMITAETGEDEILYCDKCDYAANIEKAMSPVSNPSSSKELPLQEVSTPQQKTIEEVSRFMNVEAEQMIKALAYDYDIVLEDESMETRHILVFIRADFEVNETKLINVLGAIGLELSADETIEQVFGVPAGFIGPVGLNKKLPIIFDESLVDLQNAVCGGNKPDIHLQYANSGRDFHMDNIKDVRLAREGDPCPVCDKGKLIKERGIEVGHIFKLGSVYTEAMNANFLDANGQEKPFIMGCYGIGIGRTAMSAIEQSHDDHGPIWPVQIAPFEVIIIPANTKQSDQVAMAESIYQDCLANNIDVLLDDRSERIGVKFNDADLIGAPLRVVVGKRSGEGIVELNYRVGDKDEVATKGLISLLQDKLKNLKLKES